MRTLYQPRFLLGIYTSVCLIATLHLLYLGTVTFGGHTWTTYNNYIIFKQSYFHLLQGENLYIEYVPVYWDLYKYSPSFALFMGLFAWMPDAMGLICWNLLNMLVLFAGIRSLRLKPMAEAGLLYFLLFELIISLQNVQSNALITGLILLAFSAFERNRLLSAALWLCCAGFIKVYGGIGFILFLFYPGKLRFILYSALLAATIALAPAIVTKPVQLYWQYTNWANMMSMDYATSYGWSVMGVLHTWFGAGSEIKRIVPLCGIALIFIPLLRVKKYKNLAFRRLFLAFILLAMVVFNHKAESPTFILAVTGAGIWYFSRPATPARTCLLLGIFIFTSLSHTDIFPPSIRKDWVYPYFIKAVPCIIACFVVWLEMIFYNNKLYTNEPGRLSYY